MRLMHGKPPAAQPYGSVAKGGSGSPDPVLTISSVKKEGFNPDLKSGEAVCLPNPNLELVPQKKVLKPERSDKIGRPHR